MHDGASPADIVDGEIEGIEALAKMIGDQDKDIAGRFDLGVERTVGKLGKTEEAAQFMPLFPSSPGGFFHEHPFGGSQIIQNPVSFFP